MPPHKVAGGEGLGGVAVKTGLYGQRALKTFFVGT